MVIDISKIRMTEDLFLHSLVHPRLKGNIIKVNEDLVIKKLTTFTTLTFYTEFPKNNEFKFLYNHSTLLPYIGILNILFMISSISISSLMLDLFIEK